MVRTYQTLKGHNGFADLVDYGVDSSQGHPVHFIVMEKLHDSLEQQVNTNGSLTQEKVLEISAGLLSSVQFLYLKGYVHGKIAANKIRYSKKMESQLTGLPGVKPLGNFKLEKVKSDQAKSAEKGESHTNLGLLREEILSLGAIVVFAATGHEITSINWADKSAQISTKAEMAQKGTNMEATTNGQLCKVPDFLHPFAEFAESTSDVETGLEQLMQELLKMMKGTNLLTEETESEVEEEEHVELISQLKI